jgi:hypothetical protein
VQQSLGAAGDPQVSGDAGDGREPAGGQDSGKALDVDGYKSGRA